MSNKLTSRQKECLEAIREFVKEHDYYPTLHQIAEIMSKTKHTTHPVVYGIKNVLIFKGYLNRFGEIINLK